MIIRILFKTLIESNFYVIRFKRVILLKSQNCILYTACSSPLKLAIAQGQPPSQIQNVVFFTNYQKRAYVHRNKSIVITNR